MNPTDYMSIELLIHYKKEYFSYDLSTDLESWTDELYDELKNAIKSHFNISKEFQIYDKANEVELGDIDDIKDEYESCETDDDFKNVLQLNIIIEDEMENDNDDEKDEKKEDVEIEKPINSWDEYPNLLQVIGIQEDALNIKFDLKSASSTKMKCKLQNINKNDTTLSSKLAISANKTSLKKGGINVDAEEIYNFAVFLQDKQISNGVNITTPKEDYDPTTEIYKPSPPSIDTIQQYFDSKKQNILIIWDFPKSTFGDTIMYKITISDNDKNKEITELPLKIPIPSKKIKLTITTISIIDNESYESEPSPKITINPSNVKESIKTIPPSLKLSKSTDEEKNIENIQSDARDTLLVGNLHPKVTKELLMETFGEYGEIHSIIIKRKGMALVKYKDPKKATIAKLVLNNRKLKGRIMGIGWVTPGQFPMKRNSSKNVIPAKDKFSIFFFFFFLFMTKFPFFFFFI